MTRYLNALAGLVLAFLLAAPAGAVDFPAPAAHDQCPVCGMVVSKYPAWTATVVWKDGHAHHFDGAKDLFKFLLDLQRYAPGHKAADIKAVGVTEYYGLQRIDAHGAFYVGGSDVLGPMGHELVPFASRADAEEFMHDHGGRRILTFREVDAGVLKRLDEGNGP